MGVSFISTMNTSASLLSAATTHSMPILCGVSNLNDCKLALEHHASALKFYPTSKVSPRELESILSNLSKENGVPTTFTTFVAGSVTIELLEPYWNAGATHFAVGFDLDKLSAETIVQKIREYQHRIERIKVEKSGLPCVVQCQ